MKIKFSRAAIAFAVASTFAVAAMPAFASSFVATGIGKSPNESTAMEQGYEAALRTCENQHGTNEATLILDKVKINNVWDIVMGVKCGLQ